MNTPLKLQLHKLYSRTEIKFSQVNYSSSLQKQMTMNPFTIIYLDQRKNKMKFFQFTSTVLFCIIFRYPESTPTGICYLCLFPYYPQSTYMGRFVFCIVWSPQSTHKDNYHLNFSSYPKSTDKDIK